MSSQNKEPSLGMSPEALRLLRVARAPSARTTAQHARTLAGVTSLGAVTTAALSAKALAVGLSLLGLAGGASFALLHREKPAMTAPAPRLAPALRGSARTPRADPGVHAPIGQVTPPGAPETERHASRELHGSLESSDAERGPALLTRAQAALRADPAEALRLAADYHRQFPRGALGLEAEVLGLDALSRLGRQAECTARARRFLAAHPTSIHSPRVRALGRLDP